MNAEDEDQDSLDSPSPNSARVHACLELLRVPNLFTAAADIVMGFLVTHELIEAQEKWTLGALVGASVLLYASGVVLNDVLDFEADLRDRPTRPLPSGRISRSVAGRLGWTLLVGGVVLGWVAAFLVGNMLPGVCAVALALCVLLYDFLLKRTPLGPVAMGACRALNVLLGMSALGGPLGPGNLLIAGGIGVYIAGVTWFARREAEESSRPQLVLAIFVMLSGIALLTWLPAWTDQTVPEIQADPSRWYLIMGVLGALIGWQCLRAAIEPQPPQVQLAVKQSILSLVILDAAVCYALRGTGAAVVVVLFLIPAGALGRWIRST